MHAEARAINPRAVKMIDMARTDSKLSLVIHGGAWSIDPAESGILKTHLSEAVRKGWQMLSGNAAAIDVVETVIRQMEDSGAFDAGRGAVLNANGEVELDAMIMKDDLSAGAVAALKSFQNPISIARAVMQKTPHVMLVGEGAAEFAEKAGFKKVPAASLVSEHELLRFKRKQMLEFGTVGVVALDSAGSMAAGTSTGGTSRKMRGRVGDSPLVGAGGYCDSDTGGASATGHGESFIRIAACKSACDLMRDNGAQRAAELTMQLLERRTSGKGGVILLKRNGEIGVAFNTPGMARARMASEMPEPIVEV